jgi:RNAse (barnase) inhibitor barstar
MTSSVTPGVHHVGAHRAEAVASHVRAAGGLVCRLDGAAMRTEHDLFAETARAVRFPDYFGANWDALSDCLTDLSWVPAPAYLLVVAHADQVLADEPPDRLAVWRRVLSEAARVWGEPVQDGEWWDRPPVPFTVLLVER